MAARLPAKENLGAVTLYTDRSMFVSDFPYLTYQSFASPTCTEITSLTAPLTETSGNQCYMPGAILPGVSFEFDPFIPMAGGLTYVPAGRFGLTTPFMGSNSYPDHFVIRFDEPKTKVGMDLLVLMSNRPLRVQTFGSDNELLFQYTLPGVGPSGAFFVSMRRPGSPRSTSLPTMAIPTTVPKVFRGCCSTTWRAIRACCRFRTTPRKV